MRLTFTDVFWRECTATELRCLAWKKSHFCFCQPILLHTGRGQYGIFTLLFIIKADLFYPENRIRFRRNQAWFRSQLVVVCAPAAHQFKSIILHGISLRRHSCCCFYSNLIQIRFLFIFIFLHTNIIFLPLFSFCFVKFQWFYSFLFVEHFVLSSSVITCAISINFYYY